MTIESAIDQVLRANTSLTDIVGQKIFSNMADQATEQSSAPFVVIIMDESIDDQCKGGTGITTAAFMTDVYDSVLSSAISTAGIIKSILQEYEGTHGDIYIQEVWQINKTMARNEATENHVYRLEWMVRYGSE